MGYLDSTAFAGNLFFKNHLMWSISATIFSCVFCLLSLCLHTLPLFHLDCVYQNIFVCNNRLNSSYPFSSNLFSIWECSNPQLLSEFNQLTICSNSYRACDQNIPLFDVDACIGCGKWVALDFRCHFF